MIPGQEVPLEKGICDPLQQSLAFLVAHTVKNLPAMQETWVGFLCWEDPLEEGMATQSSCLENPHGQRSLVGCSPWNFEEFDMPE